MAPKIIELVEYQSTSVSRDRLPDELGEQLWHNYGKPGAQRTLEIQFPTPQTDNRWKLRSLGTVGYIPLSPDLGLHLKPKVPLGNLFAMLEYAYDLKSFRLLDGEQQCDKLEDFYEHLADILAREILDRTRQGLHREYLSKAERLSTIRGRMALAHHIRRPWDTQVQCRYQEQSADIADNQILLWTLRQIAHHGLKRPDVSLHVHQAHRALQGSVSLMPNQSQDCLGRPYHRLNQDYRMLHGLCRFFLEQTGPGVNQGGRTMVPFLVNMNQLYERFVASWLQTHSQELLAPRGLRVKSHHTVPLLPSPRMRFDIDLVLEDICKDQIRYVIDTKYKAPSAPATSDVAQVIAYAASTGAAKAVLLYPQNLERCFKSQLPDVLVRSLTFDLAADLDQSGRRFIQALLEPSLTTS